MLIRIPKKERDQIVVRNLLKLGYNLRVVGLNYNQKEHGQIQLPMENAPQNEQGGILILYCKLCNMGL